MTSWLRYTDTVEQHTVVGDLHILKEFHSPQLDNRRDVYVWLPPSYADSADKRYPVIYMHDGQNLFDAHTSYAGEWCVDETMIALAAEGLEAIIVALPNNADRRLEYSPYPSGVAPEHDGRGDKYIAFITDTVKPMIDEEFRTLPDAAHTGIAGSSMGGLISLYALLRRPDVFSVCGAFSPAYWFGNAGLSRSVAELATGYGKVYMDIGTKEGYIFKGIPAPFGVQTNDGDNAYLEGVRRLRDGLILRGYRAGESLLYVEEKDALHNEAAWARRLPDAMRWLLKQP
jgi:predicted alpha/beta superfamily hydrolase